MADATTPVGGKTPEAPGPADSLPDIPARRRGTDPFLIGIVVGLALLVLTAVLLMFFLQQPITELPADTPGGVVQRYLGALEKENYDEAYGYLSNSMKDKPSRADFVQSQLNYGSGSGTSTRTRITKETVYGEQASVDLVTTGYYQSRSPFSSSSEWNSSSNVSLVREDGQWRLSAVPYVR